MPLTRRQFLKLTATSAGAVLFAGCTASERDAFQRELQVQSPVRMPEDLVTGLDTWYASLCRQCPAGCGIIVRVMEGRAKKIEGNPDYPLNRGKLCARGQAGIQALYHPDRIAGPLKRAGERGSGQFQPISWDNALDELGSQLKGLRDRGQADTLVLASAPERGHRGLVIKRFMEAYGGQHLTYEAVEQTVLRAAVSEILGPGPLPQFDIENTQYLLSFGTDFLETWLSPVHYSRAYGELRQGRTDKRGTFVQIEPRLSVTGANADRWVPVRPGAEGILALAIAQVLAAEGLADRDALVALTGGEGTRALEAFEPQKVTQTTGVPAQDIVQIAHRFGTQRPSLAIGGGSAAAQTNGLFNLRAILALNLLVGSVGKPGGMLQSPRSPLGRLPEDEVLASTPASPFVEWQKLTGRIRSGQPRPVNAIFFHGADVLHGLPAATGFHEGLSRVPFIVSFSSFMDETTTMADLVLPVHTYLEDWGNDVPEPGPGHQTIGFQQPIVNPIFDSRGFGDILLTLAEELGLQGTLPWSTFQDALKEGAKQLFQLRRGSVKADSPEQFWNRLLQAGGWWDKGGVPGPSAIPSFLAAWVRAWTSARAQDSPPPAPLAFPPQLPSRSLSPSFVGEAKDYPFHLIPFPSLALTEGRGAHLPWLQATPDPLSTAVWQTWVEVSPLTAKGMGLQEGDMVSVESPTGSLEAPVYIHPGVPPDIVAIPMGQGHSAFGRYAQGRGANPLSILALVLDGETGALAWAATRVRLAKTGRRVRLSKIEGEVYPVQPPDVGIVQITRLNENARAGERLDARKTP